MSHIPPPVQDLELRDRLGELLKGVLEKPDRAAHLYALHSVLRTAEVQGKPELPLDVLMEVVDRALREAGLRQSAQETIEALCNATLLERRESMTGARCVAVNEGLQHEIHAALARVEAYCRVQQQLPRRLGGPTDEVVGAVREAAFLFNEGLFFEVHEALEPVWMKQGGQVRECLQGLIQIAVAFHHLENRNHKGCLSLLKEGIEKLGGRGPVCFGLEICQFLEQAVVCAHSIECFGAEAITRFDRRMIPHMRLQE